MVAKKPSRHKDDLAQLAAIFPGLGELAGRVAPRTLAGYQDDAKLYCTWCAWDRERALDPKTLRAWIQHQVEHTTLSANTINRRRAAILTLVRVAARCDALDERIAYHFSLVEPVSLSSLRGRLKVHQALTPQQVRAVCQAPDASTLIGLRDRALLSTMASTGCRVSEVVGLEQTHLVPSGRSWRVGVLGKGQAQRRQAPCSHEAVIWINRWLKARGAAGVNVSPIFTGFAGLTLQPTPTALKSYSVWKRVKHYARQVGLPGLTPHDLRRFVGTQVTARHDVRAAQKALGHRRLARIFHKNAQPSGKSLIE
jgi:integrase/recombinase XerD